MESKRKVWLVLTRGINHPGWYVHSQHPTKTKATQVSNQANKCFGDSPDNWAVVGVPVGEDK